MLPALRKIWRMAPLPSLLRRTISPAVRWTVEKIGAAALPHIPAHLPAQQIQPGPVCVAGFTAEAVGVGKAARLNRDALAQAGYKTETVDIGGMLNAASVPPNMKAGGGVLLLSVNPPEIPKAFAWLGEAALASHYRIGCWVWELPRMPASWARYVPYFHEIWVPSQFVAGAVRARLPEAQHNKVRVVPHPVGPIAAQPDRAAFGLPKDACVVLSLFDLRSSVARKNPFAAIKTFRRAAAGTKALLLLKAGSPDAAPYLYKKLQEAVAGADNIRLVTEPLDDARAQSLIASSDIVLSLHRAEGFGLVLAEAMRQAKAVVATGWSGNMDFMNKHCAALVNYTLVEAKDTQGIYYGQKWAAPDMEHAASLLRVLIENPEKRRMLGQSAREHANSFFAPSRFTACLSADFQKLAEKTGVK